MCSRTSAVLPSTTLIHLEHLKIIGRFLLSSWVLEIWLWLTMNQQVWPMSVLIRRHSMFLGCFEEFPKMEWLVPLLLLQTTDKRLSNVPTSWKGHKTHKGFMTSSFYECITQRPWAFFWCWKQLRSWRLDSLRTSCLHIQSVWRFAICFLGSVAKPFCIL